MFGFNYSSLNVSVEMVLHHHWSHYMLGRLTSLLITIVVDECGGVNAARVVPAAAASHISCWR